MRTIKSNLHSTIYRARVVSNKDPKHICRIRVRIPSIHGSSADDGISDEGLPFAFPCFMDASYDSGTFIVPEVGSTVFVFFEGGDSQKPVYFGGSVSYEADISQYLGNSDSSNFKMSSGQRLKRAFSSDTPANVYKGDIFNRFILFKSRKGSSIEMTDEDENEHLSIIDRIGQVITMFSPTSEVDNAYGMANRGLFTLLKSKVNVVKKAILIIKSLSSSFLRFVSDPKYTKNDFTTVYKDDKAGVSVDIGKDDRILIHYKDRTFIEIKDDNINIQATNINIKGDLKVQGSIYSSNTIKGDIYGNPCVCEGTPCNYSHPEALNFDNIKPYVDDNDEQEIKE